MFRIAWYFTWITNFIVFGIAMILGGVTFFEESLLTGGYVAWTEYFVLYGGTAFALVEFVLLVIGTVFYEEDYTTNLVPWIEFGVWTALTIGAYVAYWVLNNYFLSYYIKQIIVFRSVKEEKKAADDSL